MAKKSPPVVKGRPPFRVTSAPGSPTAPVPSGLCDCGKKPVYFRRYEGRYYCKRCFCASIERKVKRTVAKYRLVQAGDRIAVGLSGGKDSSTVLSLMHAIVRPRRDISLVAVTIDEGIAGYRSTTLRCAEELCRRLGVKQRVISFRDVLGKDLDRKMKEVGQRDFCTFCGVGRRYALNRAARQLRATKLCLGHNLDDEAQSILMNYLRGDLLRAGRMGTLTDEASRKGGFVARIKPLRFIPEREVTLYAILKELPYSDEECPYISGLRPEVRDFLNEMERRHTGTKFTVVETYDRLAPHLRKALPYPGSLKSCSRCGEPSSRAVCKACELWKE